MILNGKVIAKDIGTYKLGFASGSDNLIAAGTAMSDALAQSIESIRAFSGCNPISFDKTIPIHPLRTGITIAKGGKKNPALFK